MKLIPYRRYHQKLPPVGWDDTRFTRHFWWLFKKKGKKKVQIRPGAMPPEEVKKRISEIGVGKQVEIIRVGFDGEIDDMPLIVEILYIGNEGFTGKIVNLERELIESATEKLVYAKKGGGIIDFRYDDGDIKEINVSQDQELLEQERNVDSLREIVTALDVGDTVLVAYYDAKNQGTVNAEGKLLEKDSDGNQFKMLIEKVNKIELEKKLEKTFDIEKDIVIDIEMV